MARSLLKIKYLGTSQFALDLIIGYPRQRIVYTFRNLNETYDVTDICSPEELNRDATFAALKAAGTFIDVVTPGADDVRSVTPGNVADISSAGVGVPVLRKYTITAGVAGAADDVTLETSTDFAFRIVDAFMLVGTVAVGSSAQVRTAAAGAGTLLVGAIGTATAGLNRAAGTTPTSTTALAKGSALYLRRLVLDGAAGELWLTVVREA